jgi:hypothetical protein
MFPTAEVRWFVEGALPGAARAWFHALAPGVPAEPPRTDRYVPTAAEDLGVKVRQGRVEVKQRTGEVGLERWGTVEGRVEAWRKWSLDLAADARPTDWVSVQKRRWLVTFRVRSGAVAPVPQGTVPSKGVNVEVSAIRAGKQRWWGVCLESFGPGEASRLRALRRVAAHVFAGGPPPGLGAGASMGYPAWLARAAAP